MKKYFLTIAVAFVGVCCAMQSRGQDIHFSQFYENAILRNPALTGIFTGDYKAGINFRNQWGSLSTPFITVLGSAESRVRLNKDAGDYLSFGVTATYDKAGAIDFTSMQVYPAINLNKCLEDAHQSYLSVGFAGGYIQRSFDPMKAQVANQWQNGAYNPNASTGETLEFKKIQHYDLSAGVSFNSSMGSRRPLNYYFGVAAYHLAKPKESFDPNESFVRLSTRWTGNLGVQGALTDKFGITVHINYQYQQPYQELIGGALVSWRSYDPNTHTNFTLYAGCFYRVGDAIIPQLKLDYKAYSITASYDVNNSGLKGASEGVGGFEFSLYVRGMFKHNKDVTDQVKCPRFENVGGMFFN